MIRKINNRRYSVCYRNICSLPPFDSTIPADFDNKLIYFRKKGVQVARSFAHLFSSTFFAVVRQHFFSNHCERCRFFMSRCQAPPPLKSNSSPRFQNSRRFCSMRQFYIRVIKAHFPKARGQRSLQSWCGGRADEWFCAKFLNTAAFLWQSAEFPFFTQNLFLIRSAVSGLTVTLPNMDQMTGGGLK